MKSQKKKVKKAKVAEIEIHEKIIEISFPVKLTGEIYHEMKNHCIKHNITPSDLLWFAVSRKLEAPF